MKTLFRLLSSLFVITMATGAWAAPLTNGDFSAGGSSWIDVAGSSNAFPGQANLAALDFGPPPTGIATGTDFATAVFNATGFNSAILAVLAGKGSGIIQAYDLVSGNAGNGIAYSVPTVPIGAGWNAFAYFLDVTNGIESPLVPITTAGVQTPFFFTSGGSNLLVGFGLFNDGSAGAYAGLLGIDNVRQVPEINASSASIPLAAMALGFLILGDKRRRGQSVSA